MTSKPSRARKNSISTVVATPRKPRSSRAMDARVCSHLDPGREQRIVRLTHRAQNGLDLWTGKPISPHMAEGEPLIALVAKTLERLAGTFGAADVHREIYWRDGVEVLKSSVNNALLSLRERGTVVQVPRTDGKRRPAVYRCS